MKIETKYNINDVISFKTKNSITEEIGMIQAISIHEDNEIYYTLNKPVREKDGYLYSIIINENEITGLYKKIIK